MQEPKHTCYIDGRGGLLLKIGFRVREIAKVCVKN
jgi:hypothetical protein